MTLTQSIHNFLAPAKPAPAPAPPEPRYVGKVSLYPDGKLAADQQCSVPGCKTIVRAWPVGVKPYCWGCVDHEFGC